MKFQWRYLDWAPEWAVKQTTFFQLLVGSFQVFKGLLCKRRSVSFEGLVGYGFVEGKPQEMDITNITKLDWSRWYAGWWGTRGREPWNWWREWEWVLKWIYSRMFLGRQQCLLLKKTSVSSCWKSNVRGYSYKLLPIGILVVYIAQCSHFRNARINKKSLFYASLQKVMNNNRRWHKKANFFLFIL